MKPQLCRHFCLLERTEISHKSIAFVYNNSYSSQEWSKRWDCRPDQLDGGYLGYTSKNKFNQTDLVRRHERALGWFWVVEVLQSWAVHLETGTSRSSYWVHPHLDCTCQMVWSTINIQIHRRLTSARKMPHWKRSIILRTYRTEINNSANWKIFHVLAARTENNRIVRF